MIDKVIKLYLDGMGSHSIAKKLGIGKTTVLRILKNNGVEIRARATDLPIEEIIRKIKSGKSLEEISRDYQCSSSKIQRFLKKKNIDIFEIKFLGKNPGSLPFKKIASGYIYEYIPLHLQNKYGCKRIMQHRRIMEDFLGRKLDKFETVHHKNGVRDDNRLENLELWSSRHPGGQRVEDLISWAREIIDLYG